MSQYEEIISTLNNYPFSSAFWYSILRPYWYRHLEYFWFQIDMKSNDIILQILLRQHSLELQAKATLPLTCWCVWSLRFLRSPLWAFLFFSLPWGVQRRFTSGIVLFYGGILTASPPPGRIREGQVVPSHFENTLRFFTPLYSWRMGFLMNF